MAQQPSDGAIAGVAWLSVSDEVEVRPPRAETDQNADDTDRNLCALVGSVVSPDTTPVTVSPSTMITRRPTARSERR
jgi:hypothetical protein